MKPHAVIDGAWRVCWPSSRAKHLHEAMVVITFVMAVAHLFLARKFSPGVLVLFFLPPAVAAVCWRSGVLPSTRRLGGLFLLLLIVGDAIAPFQTILPTINCFPELPWTANRILSWYCVVYLLYAFVVVPPPLFIRPLIQRHHGQEPYFAWPTCCLGLLLWLIMGPCTIWIATCLLGFASFKN